MPSDSVITGTPVLIFVLSFIAIIVFALFWVFYWSMWGIKDEEQAS
jgi:hypothetical protein